MNLAVVSKRRAFTLMEVLIVVVILAIIAAITVPQFARADDDAKEASLLATIKTLRRQIALYTLQHGGNGPHVGPPPPPGPGGLPDATRRLTERTDITGKVDPDGTYGPYLTAWPGNPFCKDAVAKNITVGNGAKPPRNGVTGWYYDLDTCIISANSTTGGESSDPK